MAPKPFHFRLYSPVFVSIINRMGAISTQEISVKKDNINNNQSMCYFVTKLCPKTNKSSDFN